MLNKKLVFSYSFLLLTSSLVGQDIIDITPDCATAGQTLDVTITGSGTSFTKGNFTQGSVTYSPTVSFDTYAFYTPSNPISSINSTTVIDDTHMIINITITDSMMSGRADVSVQYSTVNSEYYYFIMEDGFYFSNPNESKIIDVSPNSAIAGQTLNVTITGSGTSFTKGSFTQGSVTYNPSVLFDTYAFYTPSNPISSINSTTVTDDTHMIINMTIPDSIMSGRADVSVQYSTVNSEYYRFIMEDGFYFINPNESKIIDVSPNSATAGQTLNVTITGAGTSFTKGNFTQGSQTYNPILDFNMIPFYTTTNPVNLINSTTVVNDTSMIVNLTFPDSITSWIADVSVQYTTVNSEYYIFIMQDEFCVNGKISSVSDTILFKPLIQTLDVELSNTTISSNVSAWLSNDSLGCLEEIFPDSISVSGNTLTLYLNIPANALEGWWDVKVVNKGDGLISGKKLVLIEDMSSIENSAQNKTEKLHIYPNPFTLNTVIEFNNEQADKYVLMIYDVVGHKVIQKTNIIGDKVVINRDQMPVGVYIVELRGEDKILRSRMIAR